MAFTCIFQYSLFNEVTTERYAFASISRSVLDVASLQLIRANLHSSVYHSTDLPRPRLRRVPVA
jgi:hypothetical protein